MVILQIELSALISFCIHIYSIGERSNQSIIISSGPTLPKFESDFDQASI